MSSQGIESLVEQHTGVFLQPPAYVPRNSAVDGPLLGNGDVGVVVGGTADAQVFYIGKNDFWSRYSTRPLPVGKLRVLVPAAAGARYLQEQDMARAEVRGTFSQDFVMDLVLRSRSWVSATENLLVIELSVEGPHPVAVTAELAAFSGIDRFTEHYVDPTTFQRGSQEMTTAYPVSAGYDATHVWVTRKADPAGQAGREAAVAMRVIGADAVYVSDGHNRGTVSFTVMPDEPTFIVSPILSNRDTVQPLERIRQRVGELDAPRLKALNEEHREWWKRFWSASAIELGDKQLEAAWYGQLYLMACSNRPGKIAPGLWGNWVTTDHPMWHSDYHLNYNFQSAYYGVYSSNHVELAEPYYDAILAYLPIGREMAKRFNCRGVHFPVSIGPEGMTVEEFDFGQRSNAAFAVRNFISHYEYTADKDFLKERAYPFMLEVMEFWEDYLQRDDAGRYLVVGSNASEEANTGRNTNSILDLSLLRTLCEALIKTSRDLGIDEGRRAVWQDILDNLSEFPVREYEGSKVFMPSDDHRRFLRIGAWPIWPAGCISLGSDPEVLAIAHNTLAKLDWEHCDPQIFTQGVRVDYPDTLANLKKWLRVNMFANYYVDFSGGGLETCGCILMAINEMLLQSHEGSLRLFPVWPKEVPARFDRLRAVGGFLVSSELVNGRVQTVSIESERGLDCSLFNPWPGRHVEVFEGRTRLSVDQEEDRITFPTRMGGRYTIQESG